VRRKLISKSRKLVYDWGKLEGKRGSHVKKSCKEKKSGGKLGRREQGTRRSEKKLLRM
jgi:hypothetical protein